MPNTREKLIDLIGSARYGNNSLIGHNFQKGFIEKIADHLIANGVTVQKWIPVTERLPEVNVPVLVYDGKDVDGWTFYDLSYVSKYGFTHWMPLPEPPKGE